MSKKWRHAYWTKYWWYTDGCWRLEFGFILSLFLYFFRPQRSGKYYASAQQLPTMSEKSEEDEFFEKLDQQFGA